MEKDNSLNTSVVTDDRTARTRAACAAQRAENLAAMGCNVVMELCAGPSSMTLYDAYGKHGIMTHVNDIQPRWFVSRVDDLGPYFHQGDCLRVPWARAGSDMQDREWRGATVFAPPLTAGCTGTRADALMIEDVQPGYYAFLTEWQARLSGQSPNVDYTDGKNTCQMAVLVLPGRSLATPEDRRQYHRLIAYCQTFAEVETIPLVDGCVKYYDVYLTARKNA